MLDAIDGLVLRGAFLDAWSALSRARAEERSSGRARTLASRLLHHLGAPRRSLRETIRTHRLAPDDPHARIGIAFARLEHRGPLDALEWVRANAVVGEGVALEALEIEAVALSLLRDFASARRVLDRWREAAAHPEARIMCEAQLLAREDRLHEAVDVARAGLAAHPRCRRLVMTTAALLLSSGDADGAMALLGRAVKEMQAGAVAEMLFSIALAHDRHEHAAEAVERLPSLYPQAEPHVLARITRMRAEAAYRRGELAKALALLGEDDDPDLRKLSVRLRAATPEHRRVVLDVPFVRQEHLGCAPATLASLSRFFGRPADHVELADAMCYHGTPAHAERSWAESQGLVAREMRLTWDVAVALIERGIPFHVSTFVPGSGHAQAVMGFDERRRSLVLRDPSIPLPVEVDAESFLEEFRHCGPRCLVVVPADRAASLEGIELPDAALYDELYAVERALAAFDRPRALEARRRLEERAPAHVVTRAARRAIAAYDGDPSAVLAVAEDALAADPDDRLALLDRVMMQQTIAPRSVRVEALEAAARKQRAPIFLELLAKELAVDAREHRRATRLARRALAATHGSSRAMQVLARIAWSEGQVPFALEAFRFGACLEPTSDEAVRSYVSAARKALRVDDAIAFARECFDRLGARSAAPALVLADTLDELGDLRGAREVLDVACTKRPDDGALLLASSTRIAREGRTVEARTLLERARTRIDEITWARGAAILAGIEGRDEDAQLSAWRAVADAAPLATDAHAQVAMLLRRTRGARAAAEYLASRVAQAPHHRPTVRAWLDALRDGDVAEREAAVRSFLATEPADAWGRRELALTLASARRHDEARAELEAAAALDARAVDLSLTRAFAAEQRDDLAGARAAYLEALAIDADVPGAIVRVVELADVAERYALLSHLFERVEQSALSGTTFEALHAAAQPHVSQEWLTEALDRLRTRRPEIAASWLVSIRHALAARPAAVALELARDALERFPLVPEVHLDAAEAFSVTGDAARAMQHLERAIELGPHLSRAVARLANALEAQGEHDRADTLLDTARRRASFDATIALEGVRIRARRGDGLRALDELETVLDREPELEAGWDLFGAVAASGAEERRRALAIAARLAESHPASVTTQSTRAFLLLDAGQPNEALAVLDAAARRGLRATALRDATAAALALAGRTGEALAACAPGPSETVVPPEIGMRASWVHAQSGDLRAAIGVAQGVLRVHGSYVPGWQRLVELWLEANDPRSAVDAATRLVAIAPMLASSQQALGRARMAAGDKAGAKLAFERAIERDPGAVVSAALLFQLAAEARDPETVAAAMRVLERKIAEAERVGFDVEAALVRGDRAAAAKRFGEACVDAKASAPAVVDAWEALRRWGAGADAESVVLDAATSPEATAIAGALWMRAGLERLGWSFAVRAQELSPSSPAGRGAADELFDTLAQRAPEVEAKRVMRLLRWWLERDDRTWSAPFNALVARRMYARSAWWGRTWRTRRDAPAERLYTLAVSMHAVGLRRRAMELTRSAVESATDADARSFRAWIAFDEAASGRTDEAEAELARAAGGPVHGVAAYVRALTEEIVAIQRTPRRERANAYAHRRAQIAALLAEARVFPSLADVGRRSRMRLARDVRRSSPLFLGASGGGTGVSLMIAASVASSALGKADDTRVVAIVLGFGLALVAVSWFVVRPAIRAVLARV